MKKGSYRDSLKVMYIIKIIFILIIPFITFVTILIFHEVKIIESQSIENIKKVQDTVISQLTSDIDTSALKLSHMVYSSNSEVLKLATEAIDKNDDFRFAKESELNSIINLMLEPEKDIVSIIFYMNNGEKLYQKSDISLTRNDLYSLSGYKRALLDPNNVHISLYETKKNSDFYSSSTKDSLLAILTIAPSVQIDLSGKINTIVNVIKVSTWETIKNYNRGYLNGTNKLGYMYIEDVDGNQLFSTSNKININNEKYNCIETEFEVDNQKFIIKNYVRPHDLSLNAFKIALYFIFASLAIIALMLYISRNFFKKIILPIDEVSQALQKVEDGNLNIYIKPYGHLEVRVMIEQFNAMVRRLKAQKNEYEQNLKKLNRNPVEYFTYLIQEDYTPEEVSKEVPEFFNKSYILLAFILNYEVSITDINPKIIKNIFERNSRFASRCYLSILNEKTYIVMYKTNQINYHTQLLNMINELNQKLIQQLHISVSVIYSPLIFGSDKFSKTLNLLLLNKPLYLLSGKNSIIDLDSKKINYLSIIQSSEEYLPFAKALYSLNEVEIRNQKNRCFIHFSDCDIKQMKYNIYSIIYCITKYFDSNSQDLSSLLNFDINYIKAIENISDKKTIRIWFDNFLNQFIDKYKEKIDISVLDPIQYAQLFMERNFDNPNLSLSIVAEQVGYSVKYFTSTFTKVTGITFSQYLRRIRVSHAIQLLETTNKRIYEIGFLVGYNSSENFTRMFSKETGLSPTKYRANIHSNKEFI